MLLYFLILGGKKKCSGSNPTLGRWLCGRAVTLMIFAPGEYKCSTLLMPVIIGFLHVEKRAFKSFSTLTPFLLFKDPSADHKITIIITKCLRNSSGVCAVWIFYFSLPKNKLFCCSAQQIFWYLDMIWKAVKEMRCPREQARADGFQLLQEQITHREHLQESSGNSSLQNPTVSKVWIYQQVSIWALMLHVNHPWLRHKLG